MQYTLNTSNYHTFPVFEVNKLPPRSYFTGIPAGHWHRGLWTGHCPGIPV